MGGDFCTPFTDCPQIGDAPPAGGIHYFCRSHRSRKSEKDFNDQSDHTSLAGFDSEAEGKRRRQCGIVQIPFRFACRGQFELADSYADWRLCRLLIGHLTRRHTNGAIARHCHLTYSGLLAARINSRHRTDKSTKNCRKGNLFFVNPEAT